ncbi:cytochrome P450 6B5-like isoform X1 [Bombyx mandarina]|uniref:unspecific monooxygenase n=1 Tax=Bombyx mandarina TaxID=7092 RepID=A0A6J2JB84_BOMMA|nr:cytochrome P450 6B5-like isoform X1 [Bombyx mandarina]
MSVSAVVFAAFVLLVTYIYYWSTRKFEYWKRKNVPYAKPVPFFGNYMRYITLQSYIGDVMQKLCQQFPDRPYFGSFYGTEPALVLQNPEIIKQVFTKDFYYFNSRDNSDYNHNEVVTRNLFFANGDKWKVVRQNLTPLFSSSKMKNMFYLVEKCNHSLEDMLDKETKDLQIIEIRSAMIRYTLDSICSSAFGIETNTLSEGGEYSPFANMGSIIFSPSITRGLKWISRSMWPGIFYKLGLQCFPAEIDDFFERLLTEVLENRGYKPTNRNDFVDLILSLKQNDYLTGDGLVPKNVDAKKVTVKVDDALLIAQCVVFFGAGFETSATTLSAALYELAKNPEAQRRAQEEVDELLLKHNNKLNYDCLAELPYLEACMNEAMRLYPVFPNITRETVADYTFPDGLRIDKGMRVHVPVYAIHRNPDNFPDPEEFRPERHLGDAKNDIKQFTFFPFGEGPRICIGMRFGKMQTIAGLITCLKKFNFELADGMPRTLAFRSTTLLTQPSTGLFLKATPRDGWEQRIFAR